MNTPLSKIYFIHKGHEAYPEVAAYRSFFEGRFQTQEILPSKLDECTDLDHAICWYIMGFYPIRPPKAGFVIHDYRSLSVGPLSWVKDKLKSLLNAQPDARLFQNDTMRTAMDFHDKIPSFLMPMGVPPFVLEARDNSSYEKEYDFAYIGVMSAERKTVWMIDSFLKRFNNNKNFHLFGRPEAFLIERYKKNTNIIFEGNLSQGDLFKNLCHARVAVNYFPNHAPHLYQTPTKLLEYAALGLRIHSNDHPRTRETSACYGIHTTWGPNKDMFSTVPDALDWSENTALDPTPFLWPELIVRSGVPVFLDKVSAP